MVKKKDKLMYVDIFGHEILVDDCFWDYPLARKTKALLEKKLRNQNGK